MITWISTKSPVRMLDTPVGRGADNYLHENQGIDSALLAADLGVCTARVESRQRRLGLRAFTRSGVRRNI
jgi:hypothetical protein